jgi:hypothetical protein
MSAPAQDLFTTGWSHATGVHTLSEPGANAASITPNDTADISFVSRFIYVGGAGNLTVVIGGQTITFEAVPAGTLLPVRASRIMATGTSATFLVAMW